MPDNGTQISDILTEREVETLRFAQELYGAMAKENAASFGEAIGLDEESVRALVGGVAVHLEGLDFEQRREVATNFDELTAALGGAAVTDGEGATANTATRFDYKPGLPRA